MKLENMKKSQLVSMIKTVNPSIVSSGEIVKYGRKAGIRDSEKAAAAVTEKIENWQQENFVVLLLDGANKLIEARIVFIGTLNQSVVHPREVFAPAIEKRAASIIVAHNHPSNTIKPSQEDINVTKRLSEAGLLLGIPLLDHIIITVLNGHYSFKSNGLI